MDLLERYLRIGRLIESMPLITAERVAEGQPELLRWLGDICAIAKATDPLHAGVDLKLAVDALSKHAGMGGFSIDRFVAAAREVPVILYRMLSDAELQVPAEHRGGFIPAQSPLAALAAVAKVFQQASQNILVVDPYLDANALYEFAVTANEGVNIQLLAGQTKVRPGLRPAVIRWGTEYIATRPLEVKLASDALLHDRVIIIDRTQVWLMTQSLNHFAARSPATLVRFADEDNLKRDYYEGLWTNAALL